MRGSVALLLLGRAWQHLRYDTPLTALLWSPALLEGVVRDGLGLPWHAWAASERVKAGITAVEHGQGAVYGIGALVALLPLAGRAWLRVQTALLVASSLGLCGLALLYYLDHKRQLAQLLELGIQCSLPLLLALMLRERGRVKAAHQRWLRVAIAATFAGHGLYAAGYYEVPGGFVTMVMRSLGVAEPVARGLLFGAGCLDFAVALGVLAGARWRGLYWAALAYAALWGTLTALARVWSYFRWDMALERLAQWLHEAALRLPHGLVPLFVLLVVIRQARELPALRSEKT